MRGSRMIVNGSSNLVEFYVKMGKTNRNFAFDDQNENRYRCACFHKRCVT